MNETLLETAQSVLAEMLGKLGTEAEVLISETEDPRLELKSAQAGRLIGRKGQTLESLELVLNRILKKKSAEAEDTPWVAIEVDGYVVPHREPERKGRLQHAEIERLTAIAMDAAKEVKYFGKDKVIGPYRPAERRIIHMTLREDPAVDTISDEYAGPDGEKKMTIRFTGTK